MVENLAWVIITEKKNVILSHVQVRKNFVNVYKVHWFVSKPIYYRTLAFMLQFSNLNYVKLSIHKIWKDLLIHFYVVWFDILWQTLNINEFACK